jgi:1-acyl-sn-glycerol-3-phosphate acyltransferase
MTRFCRPWWIFLSALYMIRYMVPVFFYRIFKPQKIDQLVDDQFTIWPNFMLRTAKMQWEKELDRSVIEKIDWSRNVIVIGNHQSYMDIPLLMFFVNKRLGFIAKKELRRIPFLHFWMRQIHCIFIDRSKRGVGSQLLDQIRARDFATHLVLFPEGTRSKNGKLGRFKSGAFRMAEDAEAIILPIHIKGTRQAWEDRVKTGHCKNVPVMLSALEPIDMRERKEQGQRFQQVREELHEKFAVLREQE